MIALTIYLKYDLDCNNNIQCDDDKACINGKCLDPCDDENLDCIETEWCRVTNHIPYCSSKYSTEMVIVEIHPSYITATGIIVLVIEMLCCFINLKLDECDTTSCKTTSSGAELCERCQFPFIYKGITYENCTDIDQNGYWCSTKTFASGDHKMGFWGFCQDYCLKSKWYVALFLFFITMMQTFIYKLIGTLCQIIINIVFIFM